MNKIKKFIYFPGFGDGRMRPGYPEIIYVDVLFYRTLRGNRDLEELKNGRFGSYYSNRAIPFTEEGWELCMDYKKRRALIELEEKELKKKVKKLAKERK